MKEQSPVDNQNSAHSRRDIDRKQENIASASLVSVQRVSLGLALSVQCPADLEFMIESESVAVASAPSQPFGSEWPKKGESVPLVKISVILRMPTHTCQAPAKELNFGANGGTPKESQRGSKATNSCVWAVFTEVFAEKPLLKTHPQERPTGVINVKPQELRGSAASRVQRPYSDELQMKCCRRWQLCR